MALYTIEKFKTNLTQNAENRAKITACKPENQPFYVVYSDYDFMQGEKSDFTLSVASETAQGEPITLDGGFGVEKFLTTEELLEETWKRILNKTKQGLVKRAYLMDWELHNPDGTVEIYISIAPHC